MTTKELLIEEAFSFYSKPCVKDFSLNELAAKVGISKPAIYRHFKNKDDVMAEMQKHFFDVIAEHLLSIRRYKEENGTIKGTIANVYSEIPFSNMVRFFADNPKYINYLIFQFTRHQRFERVIFEELEKRGCLDEEEIQNFKKAECGQSDKNYADSFYCGISILVFIKLREKAIEEKKRGETFASTDEFAKKIAMFIKNGFAGSCRNGDIFYPTKISEKRKEELRRICEISKEDFPEENKIFTALASVIEKYDFNGVTIERIADELGMAKSSLYFYFDNKNEMIRSLIEKELAVLTQLCVENSAESKTFSEFIYLTMRTEIEFFQMKPSLLQICGWLLQKSSELHDQLDVNMHMTWEKKIPGKLERPDLGLPLTPELFKDWLGVIPVALFLTGTKKKMGREKMLDYLEQIFDFIQFGLKDKDRK